MRAWQVVSTVALVLWTATAARAEEEAAFLVGQRVRITTREGDRTRRRVGTLQRVGDGSFTLARPEHENFEIPRASVVKIERNEAPSTRGRAAAIGFGVGAVAGGILGFIEGTDCPPDGFLCVQRSAAMPALGLTVGLVGAGIGAALGHGERWDHVPAQRWQVTLAPARGRGVSARLALTF